MHFTLSGRNRRYDFVNGSRLGGFALKTRLSGLAASMNAAIASVSLRMRFELQVNIRAGVNRLLDWSEGAVIQFQVLTQAHEGQTGGLYCHNVIRPFYLQGRVNTPIALVCAAIDEYCVR
jgi:hypothetical protein